jgi:hypothetical protein
MDTALSSPTNASNVPMNTAQATLTPTTETIQIAPVSPSGKTVVESREEWDRKLRFALVLLIKDGYFRRRWLMTTARFFCPLREWTNVKLEACRKAANT